MASIVRHRGKWRAYLYVKGRRESRLFRTNREAHAWAQRREQSLTDGIAAEWQPPPIQLLPLEALRALPAVDLASKFSGVYFLWNEDKLVYVGQAGNIAKRIGYHLSSPPTPWRRATCLQIPHPWQLAIEQLYISAYLPTWRPIP